MDNNTLQHHGIRGMRWGVRRYQNSDGSLTPLGEKRYNGQLSKLKAKEQVLKRKQALKAEKNTIAELKRKAASDKLSAKEQILRDKLALKNQKQTISDLKKLNRGKKDTDSGDKVDGKALKKKDVKKMSDEELRSVINRLDMERRYRDLSPKDVSSGKRFIDDVIKPSATSAAKTVLTEFATKKGKEWLGLNSSKYETPDSLKILKDTVQELNLKKTLDSLTKDSDGTSSSTKEKSSDSDSSKKETASKTEKKSKDASWTKVKNDAHWPNDKDGPIYDAEIVEEWGLVPTKRRK